MKIALAKANIVTLATILAASTGLALVAPEAYAQANPPAPAQTSDKPAAPATEKDDADDKPNPDLPLVDLSADLMYKILGSEMASQRGQWQTGYVTMLALAQQTRDPRLARRAVELALSAKQTAEALNAVRLWRELAPKSEDATQYYLVLATMHDKLTEVLPIFAERLSKAAPQARGSLILSSYQRYLNQAKDKAQLMTQLEHLYAPYMDLPETRITLAQAALAKGDTARARAEAQAALSSKPDSELALMTLVYVLNDQAEAKKVIDEFLQKYPQAKEVRMSWARMLVDRKQYEEARNQFEILSKESNYQVTSLYALGVISLQLKDLPSTEKYLLRYLEAVASRPAEARDNSRALGMLSQIAEERGDYTAALQWLEKIPDADGGQYFNAAMRRAHLLAKVGRLEEARRLLQGLRGGKDPEKIQLLQLEAQLLRDANQVAQAYALLEDALKNFPDNTDLLYDHAMLAEKLAKLVPMENSLRKVMQLAPDNHHAYNALGYSLADRNIRLAEAYTLIEKALKMAPNDPFIMDSMGWVQFRMGRLKEAEEVLRRAYNLRPDAEIAAHLAEVLWKNGQKEEARQLLRDAKSRDPGNDTLRNTLTRLNIQP